MTFQRDWKKNSKHKRGGAQEPHLKLRSFQELTDARKESVSFRSAVSHASVVAHTHADMDSTNWIQGIIKR